MRHRLVYAVACLLAALAPLLFASPRTRGDAATYADFHGWPTHFENRPLTELPLTERERRFGGDFPGRVARFTDGRRELVIRFVSEPTRKLHPASDCFAGLGYRVRPLPLAVDADGARWGSFDAVRGDERLRVRERIHAAGGGGSWPDASSWYWAAATGTDDGPWWAVTVAERIADDEQEPTSDER